MELGALGNAAVLTEPKEKVMKVKLVLLIVAIYAVFGLGQVLPQIPPPIAGAVQAAQVDINTAMEDGLKALEGMVMLFQEDHRGTRYKRKDELVQKKIIPQATYDKIKEQVVAKQN